MDYKKIALLWRDYETNGAIGADIPAHNSFIMQL
jgi:hypothetical protein